MNFRFICQKKESQVSSKLFILLLISFNIAGQTPHQHPDHPKGNSATMYQALPYYNEACELYSNRQVDQAKRALYEAIDISFELTEAQLFLADIFYDQGKIDSAFLYYNSGIDFNIEQKPHYYFRLFETGHQLGQYAYMKHNLGHFKKLFSDQGGSDPYEKDYPYKRDDFEFYDAVLKMVYDYQYWKPKALLKHSFDSSERFISCVKDRAVVRTSRGVSLMKDDLCCKKRGSKIKGLPHGMTDLYITPDGNCAVYCLNVNGTNQLHYSMRKGKKFMTPKPFPASVNSSKWQGTPFLTGDHKFLYYSSDQNGNKDLFLIKVDLHSSQFGEPKAIDRLNTSKDEITPFFAPDQKTFFYSSNGLVGFGGQDLFSCKHFEEIEGAMFPFDPQNCGATYNSCHDDLMLRSFSNCLVITRRIENEDKCFMFEPIKQSDIYFEITPSTF